MPVTSEQNINHRTWHVCGGAVYLACGVDGYELCQPLSRGDYEVINVQVNGISRESGWRPIRVRMVRQDEGRPLVESDAPWPGSHAPIFRFSAIEVLAPLLREYGELLPLNGREAEVSI
jgi:hypothetical protein